MLWTIVCQAPPSIGFSRQEDWSGLPRPLPTDLPDLEIKPKSLMFPELVGRFFTANTTWEAWMTIYSIYKMATKVESFGVAERSAAF